MTRRDCLRLTVFAGAAAVGGAAALQGCGNDDKGSKKQAAGDCSDVSGLSQADLQTRKAVKYVDETPEPDKTCGNCKLYTPPQGGGCGSCTVVKGPIAKNGYCTAWVAQG